MQAKHLDDRRILLAFIEDARLRKTENIGASISTTAERLGLPERLLRAKMRMLHRRGLVEGCWCGCRGDVTLTSKGHAFLLQPFLQPRPNENR
jgi:hypothetical protein